jgi:hypothetical protein
MNTIPGFNGEASLSPNIGSYRGKAGFGGSGKSEVMQAFSAFSSTAFQNTLRCCSWFNGKIYCTTYRVPFFENCKCGPFGFPVCTPPVRTQLI